MEAKHTFDWGYHRTCAAQTARTPRFTSFFMSTYWCPDVKIPAPFKKGPPIYICIYTYCVYIYIYIFSLIYDTPWNYKCNARGLTFAQNLQNSQRDCNLLGCFRACFSHSESMQNIDIACVSCNFCAYLRRCQNHLLNPFEAYLEDILQNLRCFEPSPDTSTNRNILKENRTPK